MFYLVKLVRIDGNTVDLVETNDFSRAKEVWKGFYEQWAESSAERKPFVIEEPCDNGFITAFDPSLIQEIMILPLSKVPETDNPYKRRMNKEGLGPMMSGTDLMDSGYK